MEGRFLKKSIIIMLTCVMMITLSACGNINKSEKKDVSTNNKLKIYTTAFAFQSFTEQIGGKYVDVESLRQQIKAVGDRPLL